MKLVALALLLALPGLAAISRTGHGSGTTSFTLSATAATDTQLAFSYRSASTTPPALPAGWTNIPCISSCATAASGVVGSFRLACRMSATTTSGTFTNANNTVGVSYAGVNNAASGNCNVVGVTILAAGNQSNAKTSTTVSYGTIPIQSTNDWFVSFQGGSGGSTCTAADATAVDSSGDAAVSDSNAAVSSKSTTTCSVTSETWMTVVVELQGQPNTCSGTCANLNYVFSNAHCGENCNTIKVPWSGATGTGTLANNLLVVVASYPNGSTVSSIVDNQSSTYTSTKSVDAGVGGKVINVYYVPNTAAGITAITFTFGSAVADFHAEVMEFSNIATGTPTDGGCTGTIAVPATSAFGCTSTFTPTTNGDLIIYCMESTDTGTGMGTSNVVTSIYPGFPFALLTANQEFGSTCSYWQQPTAAAIAPFAVLTQVTHDNMISVGAAFKTASAGNVASGMRLVHQATQHAYAAAATVTFPCTGNLLIITSDDSDNNSGGDVLTISGTSPANTFVKLAPSQAISGDNAMFYAVNATCSTNFQLTLNSGAFMDTTLVHLYDIAGAATSPHDTDSTASSGTQGACCIAGAGNVTSAPSITPTAQPGMIFAAIGFGSGPTSGTTSSACLYDNSPYTGESDSSLMNNGNGFCHGHYSATSAIAVGWTMNNSPGLSSWFSVGSTFSAPASGGGTNNGFLTMMGVGK